MTFCGVSSRSPSARHAVLRRAARGSGGRWRSLGRASLTSHFIDAHTAGRYFGHARDCETNPAPSFCGTYSNAYDGAGLAASHLDDGAANSQTNIRVTNANIDSGSINSYVDAGVSISWYVGDGSWFKHLSDDCFASGATCPLRQGEC